ncbi:MAG: DUF262 domain-containing protein [Deltaproteobacteria bacterium]|jgi:hypothetical protein|nr:DUF262 domain-containing protein [Deltaproteobacteria bacterium]
MTNNDTGANANVTTKAESVNVQIIDLRRVLDYNTRDFEVDFLVERFNDGAFFINPEYQRNFFWDTARKSHFIESILLECPIPIMFFSGNDDGRYDIVDGAQRASTLEEFLNDDLALSDLKILNELNGFTFKRLPPPIQRRFSDTTLRVITLKASSSLELRQEIFNRYNTSALALKKTESRRDAFKGAFMEFMTECSEKPLFKQLCPISENSKKRFEDIELITRFFAFTNDYKSFEGEVSDFLDNFVEKHKNEFDRTAFETEFDAMLDFVDRRFFGGFRRDANSKFAPYARFEAIAVGAALALREKGDLYPTVRTDWADITTEKGARFKYLTTTRARYNKSRVVARVEYVKNMLLYGEERQ